MIIDAHHHVWRLSRGDYDWPTPGMAIHRDYGLDDLNRVRGDVSATILVQTTSTDAETDFMLAVAASSAGLVRGVVGWTDLRAPGAAARIGMLASRPPLVGLRPMLQNLLDPAWILRDDVSPGLDAMTRSGLTLDLLILPHQLALVPILADAHPALPMVIDHAAKPRVAAGLFQPWADDIARAARAPNVFCKLSGLVTEASTDWAVEHLCPYVDHLLAVFGPERLMWGSDWPVVELAGGYGAWIQATGRLLDGLDPGSRALIRGGAARSFYRLDRIWPS